tara:strand:- start:306 stop:524 length:219 start_codon:yes stop_codon:yes gene_type:complete
MLEGKVFCLRLLSKSMDDAHKTIRKLDPKSKFKFTKLPKPLIEEVEKETEKKSKQDDDDKENIVDEKQTVIV